MERERDGRPDTPTVDRVPRLGLSLRHNAP